MSLNRETEKDEQIFTSLQIRPMFVCHKPTKSYSDNHILF